MPIRVKMRRRNGPDLAVWGLQWACWLLAVFALGYVGFSVADQYLYQRYEDWAFERNLAGQEASVRGFLRHIVQRNDERPVTPEVAEAAEEISPAAPVGSAVDRARRKAARKAEAANAAAPPAPKRQDPSLIGRIMIPRVRVSAIVREGVDTRTLRRAVGHVPGTALPGQPGNVALAAHRDGLFSGLRGIRKNDRILVKTLDGTYEYAVEGTRIVTPRQVEVLNASSDPVLTLVTCYPFNYIGDAPKRFIVRARQVGASVRPQTGS